MDETFNRETVQQIISALHAKAASDADTIATLTARVKELETGLARLCDEISDTDTDHHGDGAHGKLCTICEAHNAARALLAQKVG